jgi:pilus assembly protein Flp/PilA
MVLRERIAAFFADESGATAIEYGLMTGLVAVAAIAAFVAFGGGVQALFGTSDTGAGAVITDANETLAD